MQTYNKVYEYQNRSVKYNKYTYSSAVMLTAMKIMIYFTYLACIFLF